MIRIAIVICCLTALSACSNSNETLPELPSFLEEREVENGPEDSFQNSTDSENNDAAPTPGADLQGNWQSACNGDEDENESTNTSLAVQGRAITLSKVVYVGSAACDGAFTISTNEFYTFTLTGEETALAAGNAKNMDRAFAKASVTASQGTLDILETQGTTLEASIAAAGLIVQDINNITAAELGVTNLIEYTIYRVDPTADGGRELRVGYTDGGLDGTSAALRPTILDPIIRFVKIN